MMDYRGLNGTICDNMWLYGAIGGGGQANSDIVIILIMTPPITLAFFNYNINLDTVKTDIVNLGENLKREK